MGRLHNQIDNVKRQIELVGKDLEVLFGELGMLVSDLRQPMASDTCEQPYRLLALAKAEHEELGARIEHLRQIGEQISHASSRISELKALIASQERLLAVVYGRLGVIAWEETASKVLSESLVHLIPQVNEQQKRIADLEMHYRQLQERVTIQKGPMHLPLRMRTWFFSEKLKRITNTHESFFTGTGKAIAEAGCIRQLASESAPCLEKEYSDLSQEMAGWNEEVTVLRQRIFSNRNKLEAAGVAGSVGRKLQELGDQYKVSADRLKMLAVSYGKIICQIPDPWKEVDVTAAVLKCYDQIRRHERIRGQLEKRIAELEIEIDISELLLIISQDEERVAHLKQTIDQFTRQISDIQISIRENRDKIGSLKMKMLPEPDISQGRELQ